jgi:hypothetical protein
VRSQHSSAVSSARTSQLPPWSKRKEDRRTELVVPLFLLDPRLAHPPPLLLVELTPEKLEPLLARIDAEFGRPDESVRVGGSTL